MTRSILAILILGLAGSAKAEVSFGIPCEVRGVTSYWVEFEHKDGWVTIWECEKDKLSGWEIGMGWGYHVAEYPALWQDVVNHLSWCYHHWPIASSAFELAIDYCYEQRQDWYVPRARKRGPDMTRRLEVAP
jgi:hypothetical protein